MQIKPKDYRNFKQGDKTDGYLTAELTIKFSLRSAGWAGNDKMALYPIQSVLNIINQILKYTCILKADELVTYSAQWKRPKDSDFTTISIDKE